MTQQQPVLSALTSSLPMSLPAAIAEIADLGFQSIDVPPSAAERTTKEELRKRGLAVGCVALERDQPDGLDLASGDAHIRRRSLEYFLQAIDHTAELEAPVAYLTPPTATDAAIRELWQVAMLQLAERARRNAIRLCVEHFPHRLLPTVGETLHWLQQVDHDALALLIDVGHCLISGEDPAAMIRDAGERLGYVHVDDNDGVDDLHWALLDGQLTREHLVATLAALREVSYRGAVCLELNPSLPQPAENLRRGRAILESCLF